MAKEAYTLILAFIWAVFAVSYSLIGYSREWLVIATICWIAAAITVLRIIYNNLSES